MQVMDQAAVLVALEMVLVTVRVAEAQAAEIQIVMMTIFNLAE